ncbi:Protein of unknown function DUF4498 [Phytophthora cactorum]|nr:Protein of unknown function DUF4498 [Phytophthora cactorum]
MKPRPPKRSVPPLDDRQTQSPSVPALHLQQPRQPQQHGRPPAGRSLFERPSSSSPRIRVTRAFSQIEEPATLQELQELLAPTSKKTLDVRRLVSPARSRGATDTAVIQTSPVPPTSPASLPHSSPVLRKQATGSSDGSSVTNSPQSAAWGRLGLPPRNVSAGRDEAAERRRKVSIGRAEDATVALRRNASLGHSETGAGVEPRRDSSEWADTAARLSRRVQELELENFRLKNGKEPPKSFAGGEMHALRMAESDVASVSVGGNQPRGSLNKSRSCANGFGFTGLTVAEAAAASHRTRTRRLASAASATEAAVKLRSGYWNGANNVKSSFSCNNLADLEQPEFMLEKLRTFPSAASTIANGGNKIGTTAPTVAAAPRPTASPALKTTKRASVRDVRMWVGTWNMGAADPFDDGKGIIDEQRSATMLQNFLPHGYQLYVLGVQEGVSENVYHAVEAYLNRNERGARYYRMEMRNSDFMVNHKNYPPDAVIDAVHGRGDGAFVGTKFTGMAVFYCADIQDKVKLIRAGAHKFKLTSGSKGGVAVALMINHTTIVFVNCHLDARNDTYRREQIRNLNASLGRVMGHYSFDLTEQFHHVVWMGDMNYRIVLLDPQMVLHMLEEGRNLELHDKFDGLLNDRRNGGVFEGFTEPHKFPDFYPTYKKFPKRGPVNETLRCGHLSFGVCSTRNHSIREASAVNGSYFDQARVVRQMKAQNRSVSTVLRVFNMVLVWGDSNTVVPKKTRIVAPLVGEDSKQCDVIGERCQGSNGLNLSLNAVIQHSRPLEQLHMLVWEEGGEVKYRIPLYNDSMRVHLDGHPLLVVFSVRSKTFANSRQNAMPALTNGSNTKPGTIDPVKTPTGSFEHLPDALPFLQDYEIRQKLLQWNLSDTLQLQRFLVHRRLPSEADEALLKEFFQDRTVHRNSTARISRHCGRDGSVRGCIDEDFDGCNAGDLLTEMLANPDSDNCDVFSEEDKQEFIFQLFSALVIGGGALCQADSRIQAYESATRTLYRALVSVKKSVADANGKRDIEITSRVYRVHFYHSFYWLKTCHHPSPLAIDLMERVPIRLWALSGQR